MFVIPDVGAAGIGRIGTDPTNFGQDLSNIFLRPSLANLLPSLVELCQT